MDPSVTVASVNLPTPKMKILATSPVAPIHRKAKLLTRCLLREVVAAANPLALLLMVEDEMRYGIQEWPYRALFWFGFSFCRRKESERERERARESESEQVSKLSLEAEG